MRAQSLSLLVAVVLMAGAGGCWKQHCENDGDCLPGERCDLSTNRCVVPDGGVDAGDAGVVDGGDAAPPECGESSECTEPTAPICDATDLECRACIDHAECADRDSSTPVCDAPRCVECTESASHCTDPTPICDATDLECRGCVGHAECAARDASTPACDGASCVECTDSVLHCSDSTPICDATDLECRGCGGHAECATRDASTPACDGAACVECTDSALHCSGTTPICEPTTSQCRPCASHGECAMAGGVCDWATGACLSAAEVIYVDDDTCSAVGDGSPATPFCSLQDGVDAVTTGRTTILVADGAYDEIVVQDAGALWIVGGGPTVELTTMFNNTSVVYVSGSSDLTLENMTVRDAGGTGTGVECVGNVTTQPVVTLTRNTVSGNAGGGVVSTSCTVSLDGNTVSGNAGGGISLNSSDFTVVNNIVALNGSGSSSYGGLSVFSPGTMADIWHNTVVDNTATGAIPAGIRCIDPVDVDGSIVYLNDNGDLSAACNATYSWTTTDGAPGFVGGGDYHLQPTSPCVDQGDPASTLDHDIDGELRPQGGGPDIGADEVQ